MYDDFVKRKDMKREGFSSGSAHNFPTNGGNTRYTLPISTRVGVGGGGGAGGVGTLEAAAGGGSGGGLTKFDRHDPRQVRIIIHHELIFKGPYSCCRSHPSAADSILINYRVIVATFLFVPTGPDLRGHSEDDCA